MVAPAVVRARGLPAGLTAALLSYTVLFGGLLAVPLLLERVFSATPAHAGLILTTVPLTLALVAEAGGFMADRSGPRLPTVSGMGLAVGGLLLLEGVRSGTGPFLFAGLLLLGLGMGLFIPANNASIMKAAPASNLGLTGGLLNMMRGLGASFGVALVSAALLLQAGTGPSHVAPPGASPRRASLGPLRVSDGSRSGRAPLPRAAAAGPGALGNVRGSAQRGTAARRRSGSPAVVVSSQESSRRP